MLKIYQSTDRGLITLDALPIKGSWLHLVNPSSEERERVSQATGVPLDFLEYPLDEEEIPRIEFSDTCVLVIIKIPVVHGTVYDCIPLGIIVSDELVTTVCLEENAVTEELCSGQVKGFYTFKRTRFLLYVLYKAAVLYLRYLRQIDKKSEEIRAKLRRSTGNEEVISLLDLGKSLVYFTTSLRSNGIVMEKLLKSYLGQGAEPSEQTRFLKMYAEDMELLEDVITENKQAIEMGDVYTSILNTTMDSLISNNLNIVMKFLTAVTIILMIPTMVASFYGMNVPLPGQHSPHAFAGTLIVSAALTLLTVFIFRQRHMF